MSTSGIAFWERSLPRQYDIASCFFPTRDLIPGDKLRPGLICGVYAAAKAPVSSVLVAYGTTNLKRDTRANLDLIINDHAALIRCGLAAPTRFDLDNLAILPWTSAYFGCWGARPTPVLGSLPKLHRDIFVDLMADRDDRLASP